jgi:sulfur-oxidizing protein SoxY
MNNTRRTVIKTTSAFGTLVALGLVTQQQAMAAVDRAAFDVKTIDDAFKAIGGKPATSDQVSVIAPDIAENGAVVPVGATSNIPNTTEIFLIVEKKPHAPVGRF